MAGRVLPPLVGIKSSNPRMKPGHPLITKVLHPEYASMFDTGDKVPALIVVYANGSVCPTLTVCVRANVSIFPQTPR